MRVNYLYDQSIKIELIFLYRDMPCSDLSPQGKHNFSDSKNIVRAVNVFTSTNNVYGTIIFLFGGYKEETENPEKIVVGTKGWSNIINSPLTLHECQTIKDLVDLNWRVIILDSMQFVTPDNTVHNEMWIEEYIEWINQTFPENKEEKANKKFLVGFSSGAYIVGLHLMHLAGTKENRSTIDGYGIFSYPVYLNQSAKMTKFNTSHFEGKSILFLSGSKAKDNKDNSPNVDGYLNTKELYDIACNASTTHLEWKTLDTGHRIFEAQDTGKSNVATIIDKWFKSLS